MIDFGSNPTIIEYAIYASDSNNEQARYPQEDYFMFVYGDLDEIINEMNLDSSEANVDLKDVRGMVIELNGSICFDAGKATLKPKLKEFLDGEVFDEMIEALILISQEESLKDFN